MRNRGLRWSVPISFVLLSLALLLFARGATNEAGRDAHENGDYPRGEQIFARLLYLNVNEPWVAHNNRGVERYSQRNWDGAIEDFGVALKGAPKERRCHVALNLAWSHEAKGDELAQKGLAAEARESYSAGYTVLVDTGCGTPPTATPSPSQTSTSKEPSSTSSSPTPGQSGSPSPSGSPTPQETDDEKANKTKKRLEEKKDKSNSASSTSSSSSSGTETATTASMDPGEQSAKLSQKQQSAEVQRQSSTQWESRSPGPKVDRPW